MRIRHGETHRESYFVNGSVYDCVRLTKANDVGMLHRDSAVAQACEELLPYWPSQNKVDAQHRPADTPARVVTARSCSLRTTKALGASIEACTSEYKFEERCGLSMSYLGTWIGAVGSGLRKDYLAAAMYLWKLPESRPTYLFLGW